MPSSKTDLAASILQINRAGGESAYSAVTPAVEVGPPQQTVAPAIAQSTALGVSTAFIALMVPPILYRLFPAALPDAAKTALHCLSPAPPPAARP